MNIIAILENIRSLHNVGSIFRTADGLGISYLYCVGTTGHPHPEAPWRRDHLALQKTALGAEQTVSWEYQTQTPPILKQLKQNGYVTVSLEKTATSISLTDWQPPSGQIALVVGNERAGIDAATLAASDVTLHLPMLGRKESFNVTIAFAIAAFYLLHQTIR